MVTCAIPELNSCCYFISLKTGAKLCGFIALVGCLFLAIISGLEMIFVLKFIDEEEHASTIWELGFEIGLQLMHMTSSCCMITGVYQERASLVRPWLFTAILMAVMDFFFMDSLVGRLLYGYGGSDSFTLLSIQWIFLSGLTLVDDVYGWLVVFSYYRTINTGDRIV